MKITKNILTTVMAALLLTGCAEEVNSPSVQEEGIRFVATIGGDGDLSVTRASNGHSSRVSVDEMDGNYPQQLFLHTITSPWRQQASGAMTRATMVNELAQISSFGVSGYHYAPATETLASKNANFFYNAEATKKYEGLWETNKPYYFPQSNEKVAFYAYLPYGGADVTLASESTVGPMALTYRVDLNKSNQDDLMTATAIGLDFNPAIEVPLTFKHALTAVSIELGDQVAAGKIQKIYFDNIAYEGVYRVGQGWTSTTLSTDTLSFNSLITSPDLKVIDDSRPVFMIPQKFTNDTQRINVVLSDDEGTYLLRKSLKGTEWMAGTAVKYQITTSSINFAYVGTVTYPVRWGANAFSLKTEYATGESIGVFTVDKNTGKVVEANVEYKKDANGKWKSTSDRLHFEADRIYYAYYPYRSNLPGGPEAGSTVTADTDATTFFNSAIQSWAVSADQGSVDKLLANDMQVSKATDSNTSALQFSMQHAMGLAEMTLEEKTFTGNIRYYLSTDTDYEWTGVATETIRASEKLANGMKACKSSDTKYYYVVKPGVATTFTCGVNNVANQWNDSYSVTIASGARGGFTAAVSNSTTLPAEKEWVLAVGDVFFNDGSLAKNCNNYPNTDYPNRKAVGLVLSTETSTTDYNTNGFTHGYVICAQQRRADTWSSSGYRNGNYTGRLASSYYVAGAGRTAQQNLLKFFIENLDGYQDCRTVMNHAGYKANPDNFRAINYANQYNTSLPVTTPHGNCSGWYLPSSGQLYLYVKNIGGIPANTLANPYFHSTYGFRWNGYATTVVNNFNNAYSNRGFATKNSNNLYTSVTVGYPASLYASTEIDNTYVYNLCPWTDNNCYFDANDPKYDTGQQFCVRPVLAF